MEALFHLVHHEPRLGWDDEAVGGCSTRQMRVGKDSSAGARACSSHGLGPGLGDGENAIPREICYLGKVRSNILVSGCGEPVPGRGRQRAGSRLKAGGSDPH